MEEKKYIIMLYFQEINKLLYPFKMRIRLYMIGHPHRFDPMKDFVFSKVRSEFFVAIFFVLVDFPKEG